MSDVCSSSGNWAWGKDHWSYWEEHLVELWDFADGHMLRGTAKHQDKKGSKDGKGKDSYYNSWKEEKACKRTAVLAGSLPAVL